MSNNHWIECVPNFSEGRDPSVMERIRRAIVSVGGARLLDQSADADHHRSVFTFAGPPDDLAEAVLRAAAVAVEAIDLREHCGAHPRIGALDVVPFIPLDDSTRQQCLDVALRTGEQLWERLGVPVYLYGDAARIDERRRLENVRRGQFDGVRALLPEDASRRPDIGGPALHETAGATAVGVRKILIAYNVVLDTPDVAVAKEIAVRIRESSGGLWAVKALGLSLASRGLAQVSMNLTDFEVTPPHVAFERVQQEARRLGADAIESEIVGLIPRKALDLATGCDLRLRSFHAGQILENRLAEARCDMAGEE